jgi:hypothetical protein
MEYADQSIKTSKTMKNLLILVAMIYVGSFLVGYLMAHIQMPFAEDMNMELVDSLSKQEPFTTILEYLTAGNLGMAIAITFFVNLIFAAFLTTTLPGVIPFLGAVGSVGISVFRGFIVGLAYYGVFQVSIGYTIVAIGTLMLEIGAYVFAGAAGINVSMATVLPQRRYGVQSRWIAFREAWKDVIKIYFIVVILLALGAIWEMTGIAIFLF